MKTQNSNNQLNPPAEVKRRSRGTAARLFVTDKYNLEIKKTLSFVWFCRAALIGMCNSQSQNELHEFLRAYKFINRAIFKRTSFPKRFGLFRKLNSGEWSPAMAVFFPLRQSVVHLVRDFFERKTILGGVPGLLSPMYGVG